MSPSQKTWQAGTNRSNRLKLPKNNVTIQSRMGQHVGRERYRNIICVPTGRVFLIMELKIKYLFSRLKYSHAE
ncbi:MAG: hypothetical protein LBG58_09090 [Planctomycetaceae bacterium]|nr:hypothetical protein [Planctomycetaceae bacterium]